MNHRDNLSPTDGLRETPKGRAPLLRVENLSKHFPGTKALDRVNFDLRSGEVHILFGENGAGKSTLVQVIAGVHKPTHGKVYLHDKPVQFSSVHDARSYGVSAVFQEFSLIPQLTVEENLFLGEEPGRFGLISGAAASRQAKAMIADLGFPLRPQDPVMYLSRAEQQMVEIAKAFRSKPAIMIFDEPTSSLTERETDRLFALIADLKRQGIGIIYITHRMSEIHRIGDRITVFRDGRHVTTTKVSDVDDEKLVELMTGRVISQLFPSIAFRPKATVLETKSLATADGTLIDASIKAREGEVVGIAGLIGSGKSQIGRACFGVDKIGGGTVTLCGADVTGKSPRQMLDRGLFYVTSDRHNEGLVMIHTVRENLVLPSLNLPSLSAGPFLRRRNEQTLVRDLIAQLNLQPPRSELALEHFSGGNQQKVLVGKALARPVRVFIFDEPTVGVDVGARAAIYELIGKLCEEGAAIVLISSDMPEILHLTNRVYVMHRGKLRAELQHDEISESAILHHFFDGEARIPPAELHQSSGAPHL